MKVSNFSIGYHTWGKVTECWLAEKEGFFFKHEGNFGNQEGMITDADWLRTPALSWFLASIRFWKGSPNIKKTA